MLSRISYLESETEAIVRKAAQLALQRSSASNDTTIATPLTVREQMRRLQSQHVMATACTHIASYIHMHRPKVAAGKKGLWIPLEHPPQIPGQ